MARFDLAFFLCCCKACLGSPDESGEESYYELLGLDNDATSDEIKRAYKRQSLQMHPDKLAQKGKTVTEEDQARFTRMKEAYEVLSDPHKRETYDVIGAKGMKWIEEPLSMDPQEMAQNFASSSTLDRAKIFSIFVFFAVAIFIQPILICLQVDGTFGGDSKWLVVLIPMWIWNVMIAFYHVRVIMMGEMPRPDHIPEEEWEDPLPIKKRISSFIRFALFFIFELQTALHMDGIISYSWLYVLMPLFMLEVYSLWKVLPQSRRVVLTIDELEAALDKSLSQLTPEEKEGVARHYVPVKASNTAEYDTAVKEVFSAKQEIMKICVRIIFVLFLVLQLDNYINWSWWLIFAPFFVMSFCICFGDLQLHAEVQASAQEQLFSPSVSGDAGTTTDYGAMEEGKINTGGGDGNNNEQESTPDPLSEEEKEGIKARVFQSSSKLFSSCCSQLGFLILLCVGVARVQGAGFSSVWIFSPFLFIASIILCLLGCMIFCVSPMDEEDMIFDPNNPIPGSAYMNMDGHNMSTYVYAHAAQQGSSSPSSSENVDARTHTPAPETKPLKEPTPTGFASTDENTLGQQQQPQTTNTTQVGLSVASMEAARDAFELVSGNETEKDVTPISTETLPTTTSPQTIDLLDPYTQSSDGTTDKESSSVVPTASEVEDLD